MGVATSTEGTTYSKALSAWDEWNPEWLINKLNTWKPEDVVASFTCDEVMRAFMEGYLQGVTRKIGGDND
jgi:hypothetical protein